MPRLFCVATPLEIWKQREIELFYAPPSYDIFLE